MRQLQGIDTSFVALETPTSPMHIGSIQFYDPSTAPGGFVRFKDILAFIQSRLSLSKMVRQRLVRVPFDLDHPYWIEDENFDLEYHVRHIALPQPGDWRQLCIQAARTFARPLDLSRPPWEFTVVEGLNNIPELPSGSFAMIWKVHHAAIDGMSGVDLIEALHTLDPAAKAPTGADGWKAEKIPHPLELVARSALNAATNPWRQFEAGARAVPGLARVIKGVLGKELEVSRELIPPRTRFNGAISPHRVVEARSFPLQDIKMIRNLSPGAKINDVFLAIIGGAMRKYLASKDELPDKSLTALAPISVRTKEQKGDMGNQVAAMTVVLGTTIGDAAERLRFIHANTLKSKAVTEALGAQNMTDISKNSPALFMAVGARLFNRMRLAERLAPAYSTVITNVPGPTVPLYSAGARLEKTMGLFCLADGLGLGHVVQSYVDLATISFTADRGMMPDPEYYADCLAESFAELADASRAMVKTSMAGKDRRA